MDIQTVAEETYRIEVRIPHVDSLFSTYFIREGRGVLIEPGPSATIPFIKEAMGELGMTEPAYVIPTHIHLDHGGAAGSLASLFPEARIVIHPRGSKHLIDPARLIESTRMAFGDDFEDRYGMIEAVPESQVLIPQDGEILPAGGRELKIIYAPGHAPHHLAIFDLKTRGLFCGEALGVPKPGAESIPFPAAAPPAFDLEEYLKTMERLRQLHPEILFYSHDGTGANPESLISTVAENTRLMGDFILGGLREGKTEEAISSKLRDYFFDRLGVDLGEMIEGMTFRGFMHYFKKQGIFQDREI